MARRLWVPKPPARPAPYRGDCFLGEIELLEEGSIFQNAYVEVFNDRVRFPSGDEGTSFRWRWVAPYGVIALPRLPDGSVVLIELFRHTERGWQLEAPRGFGAADQTPEQAVRREIEEETGYQATNVTLWRVMGSEDYPVHLFFADLAAEPLCAQQDQREAIRALHRFAPSELRALLRDPRIHDPETLALLTAALLGE